MYVVSFLYRKYNKFFSFEFLDMKEAYKFFNEKRLNDRDAECVKIRFENK